MNAVVAKETPQIVNQDDAPMVAMIERIAMDPSIPIDRLEKMLAMKERMEEQAAARAFAEAFSRMQSALPVIPERGEIRDRSNKVQSTYPLWEDVNAALRGPLADNGLSMSFDRRKEDGKIFIGCVCTHKLGHSQRAEIDLPRDDSGSKNAVQGEGSTVSYGQRYSSKMLFNWVSEGTEDDDGVRAGGPPVQEAPKQQYSWANTVTQDLPEGSTPKDKAEAITVALCAQFRRMKGLRQLSNEWDRREAIIDKLENEYPNMHLRVIDAYELRVMEIKENANA